MQKPRELAVLSNQKSKPPNVAWAFLSSSIALDASLIPAPASSSALIEPQRLIMSHVIAAEA
jgi:hypothetical protein